jgi:hypothetical protein
VRSACWIQGSASLEQLLGLGHGEPQVRLADLGQLAFQPQPVQPQPHTTPGGQHEPQARRRAQHQQLQLPQRVRAQLVHIVDQSQTRSASGARSFNSRSMIAQPSRSGAAVIARTSAEPGPVCRSAASTDSQNRCGSRSPRPTGTHATLPSRPARPIQDRSSTVLPLPADADTTVTGAAPSRSNSRGRDTIPRAPGRATRPATASDPSAGPMARSSHHADQRARRAWAVPAKPPRSGRRLQRHAGEGRVPLANLPALSGGSGSPGSHPVQAADLHGSGPQLAHSHWEWSTEPLLLSDRAVGASLRQRLWPGVLCGRC